MVDCKEIPHRQSIGLQLSIKPTDPQWSLRGNYQVCSGQVLSLSVWLALITSVMISSLCEGLVSDSLQPPAWSVGHLA